MSESDIWQKRCEDLTAADRLEIDRQTKRAKAVAEAMVAGWSEERHSLYVNAWFELSNGNLEPLARYIRKGWAVEGPLADSLAGMIDGRVLRPMDERFEIVVKGRDGNKRTFRQRLHEHREKVRIALFVNRRLDQGRSVDDASGEACTYFNCSRRKVDGARKHLQQMLDPTRNEFGNLDPLGTIADIIEAFPNE